MSPAGRTTAAVREPPVATRRMQQDVGVDRPLSARVVAAVVLSLTGVLAACSDLERAAPEASRSAPAASTASVATQVPITPPSTPTPLPPASSRPQFDCGKPTVAVTELTFDMRAAADAERDTVYDEYRLQKLEFTLVNTSRHQIEVSDAYAVFIYPKRRADSSVEPVRAHRYPVTAIIGSTGHPRRLGGHASIDDNWSLAGSGVTISDAAAEPTARIEPVWNYIREDVESACVRTPARSLKIGQHPDEYGVPTVTGARRVSGGVLGTVKYCWTAGFSGPEAAVLDGTKLFALLADGTKVQSRDASDPVARAAGAGRGRVPVGDGTCRTTTIFFGTAGAVVAVAYPGSYGVPWRWRLA